MSSSILGTMRDRGTSTSTSTSTKIRRSSIAVPEALDVGAFARRAPRIRPMVVRPLPDVLRSGVESLSGVSMRDVRVHYNSPEPDRLGALAYARGTDIHVSPGQERHVPHEAWHVVQQAQGRVARLGSDAHGVPLSTDPKLEREADTIGRGIVRRLAGAPAPPGSGPVVPRTTSDAPVQLVRRAVTGPQSPVTLAVIEQAAANHLEQTNELGPERDEHFWDADNERNLDRWVRQLDERLIALRQSIGPDDSFTTEQVEAQANVPAQRVRSVLVTLSLLRNLLNTKHAEFSAHMRVQAEIKQFEYKEKEEYKAKNSDEAKEQREQELLLKERERIRLEKQAGSARRTKGLGRKWAKHQTDLKRTNQVMFAQHVPAKAASIQRSLKSQNICDAVFHLDKAFWLADPSRFELGSAKGKSRMEYTFSAAGAKSLLEDYLICGSGDYLDDNEEPWGGETAHPYYTIWKTNELGAYGVGSERLKELSGSVQLIRAFDPDNVEIQPDI